MTSVRGQLGDYVHILSGFAFKSSLFNSEGRGLPLVRIRDVIPGRSETYYDGPYEPRFLVHDNDLLIGMDGEFNVAAWKGGEALLNQRVCRVSVASPEHLDPGYLRHLLPAELKRLEDQTPFATVKHLSVNRLRSIEVTLPPIWEQRRIAAILDRADALWDNRRAALDRLGELRQSIFNDTFHAHEWPLVESSQIIVGMRNGISPSAKGKIPGRVLTLSAVTGGEFDPSQAKDAMFSSRPAPNQHVRRGHLLICRGNGNISLVGRAVVAQEDHPGLVIPDTVIGAELDTSQVVPTYFAAAWQQRSTRNQIESSARTTSGIHKVNQQTLGEVRIPLPPISVQKEFAERVANVRSFERRLRAHALSIHAMVASLQSRAFSGRL